MTTQAIHEIIAERALTATEKQHLVELFLRNQGIEGIRMAVDAVVDARSEASAAYAAAFLAKLPNQEEGKNRGMRALLSRNPQWIAAIATLVPYADEETRKQLVQYVLLNLQAPSVQGVAYRLAQHFPDHMRRHRKALAEQGLFELLLPGAPQSWVRALVSRYRRTRSGQPAIWLSKIGTHCSREALKRLEREAPSSRKQFFAALL